MKLNAWALAFGLSLGILGVGAAQAAENEPKAARDVQTQSTTHRTPVSDNILLANNGAAADAAPALAKNDEPTTGTPPSSGSPQPPGRSQGSGPANYDQWHFSITPYLWFPGVRGNVGALNRDVSVHASPIDLLSHFRFGLMGHADARWKRLVLPLDVFWVRLADDGAGPFPPLAARTADVKARAFILTPKVGYRLVDEEKIKFDVLTGFRYWHLGQRLKFSPSIFNLDVDRSQNWVDPLVGVRVVAPVANKFEITLAGDVGGWGVGAKLDYQVAGFLGYRVKENVTLQAGYRYLDVDYHAGAVRNFLFDVTLSGIAVGVTINLK
jgi:hypothetical protein